jgi:hypothetical protein
MYTLYNLFLIVNQQLRRYKVEEKLHTSGVREQKRLNATDLGIEQKCPLSCSLKPLNGSNTGLNIVQTAPPHKLRRLSTSILLRLHRMSEHILFHLRSSGVKVRKSCLCV